MEGTQDAEAVLGPPPHLALDLRLRGPQLTPLDLLRWGTQALGLLAAGVVALVLAVFGGWRWWLLVAVALGLPWLGWRWYRARHPAPVLPAARLLLFEQCLVLQTANGGQQLYDLAAGTQVLLRYEGYDGELRSVGGAGRHGRSYYSGRLNEIQLSGGPVYTFYVPDQATEEALRRELRRWYLRGVNLHEYRLHDGQPGNRTLLLRPEPDYDEQLALWHACGFSLYGRPAPPGARPSAGSA